MICPYRKQIEEVDGTKSEYYMRCYGTECTFYVEANTIGAKEYCSRADSEIYDASHDATIKLL